MRLAYFLLLISTASISQECSKIEDKLERLNCYDAKDTKHTELADPVVRNFRKPLLDSLKNANSAIFKNEVIYQNEIIDTPVLCGEVNAHNSYGAYTGYKPYISYSGSANVIDSETNWLINYFCKNVSFSHFPGAKPKSNDPLSTLARAMIYPQIELSNIAVFKNEMSTSKGGVDVACGKVNYPLPRKEYVGFRDYFMVGNSALLHTSRKKSQPFNHLLNLFCDTDSKHVSSYEQWHVLKMEEVNYVASIQNDSAILVSCKSGTPSVNFYVSKGIITSSREKLVNKSINKEYKALPNDDHSISINLEKSSGKNFLADFSNRETSRLSTGYYSYYDYDTNGFIESINQFITTCPSYNWKKYWNVKTAGRNK